MRESSSIMILVALVAFGSAFSVAGGDALVFKHDGKIVEKRPVSDMEGVQVPDGLVEQFYPGGADRARTEWKGGLKNGKDEGWFENGKQEYKGSWSKGLRDGKWVFWYPNGNKRSESEWSDGKRNGTESEWYENGRQYSLCNWKDGVLDGESKAWYPDGTIQYECAWKNGEPSGKWTFWSPAGKKAREEEMQGKLSVRTYYNDAGEIVKRTAFLGRNSLGTEIKEWEETYKDGKVANRREYM